MPSLSYSQYLLQAPDDVTRGIVQIITNESIFLKILGFDEINDFTKPYNQQTKLGGIAFRGLNQTYTEDTGVVNPVVEVAKIFGGAVKVDRQLTKGNSGRSARANAIAAKTKKASLHFDKYCIDGDSTADPTQFDGLNVRLTGKQVLTAGANGAALTLAMLDALLDVVVGPNSRKHLVMNKACRTKTKQLVQSSAGGAAVGDFTNGQIATYNGAAIDVVDEDGDEAAILGADETQGSSAVTQSIYAVIPGQMEEEYMRGLVRRVDGAPPVEFADYGERDGVWSGLVESVMGLALYHPRSAARLKGVL